MRQAVQLLRCKAHKACQLAGRYPLPNTGLLGIQEYTSNTRLFSAADGIPSLKQQIRQLYKRIHPDLFQDHREAREANGRSLQLLQEYLDSAKRGGEVGRTAGVPYKFSFYLRDSSAELEELEGGAGKLQHVAVSLPPPARMEAAAAAAGQYPRATQLAIAKLLTACGLSSAFIGGIKHSSRDSLLACTLDEKVVSNTLREFIPAAAELARQQGLQQAGPRAQMGMIRTALRMARQASVGFGPSMRRASATEQLQLLQKLARVVDSVEQADVSGVHIVIDTEPEQQVDMWGNLCLRAGEPALAWSAVLSQPVLQQCRQQKAVASQLESLEGRVAAAMGVAMLYAAPDIAVTPEYIALLHALAHVGQQLGPVQEAQLRNVPVCVTAAAARTGSPGSGLFAGFEADTLLGLVRVPVNSDAIGIYRYLQEAAPGVSAAIAHKHRADAELEQLRSLTEKRLSLRILSRDPDLGPDQFKAACLRMLQGSRSLSQLLEGVCVRISFSNQVAAEGDIVDIAWDFEV